MVSAARVSVAVHATMSLLWLAFALLQLNDPEPWAMFVAYAASAACSLAAALVAAGAVPRVPVEATFSAALIALWPPAALLAQRAVAAALATPAAAALERTRPALAALAESEVAREIAGLALAVAWVAMAVVPQVCAVRDACWQLTTLCRD